MLTTGRISSEMLRKAAGMGVPIVVSRTSPTSLSVQLAHEWNVTLVGYAQGRRLRIYADPAGRISPPWNACIGPATPHSVQVNGARCPA